MPRRITRKQIQEARPHVVQAIESLRTTSVPQAQAVELVLEFALDQAAADESRPTGPKKSVSIELDPALHTRASGSGKKLSRLVEEGWAEFEAGEWEPVQPRPMFAAGRAAYYGKRGADTPAKSTMTVSVSAEAFAAAEAAADRLVAAKEWPTARGYKLNARHVAAQWLARQFPDPDEDKQQAAE